MYAVNLLENSLRLLVAGAMVFMFSTRSIMADDKGAKVGEKETVKVELEDTKIDMQDKVEAGTILFEVKNSTESEHSFAIKGEASKGDNVDEKIEGKIAPGETRTLELSLLPGVYKVYCPVANHEESGVWVTLAVVERDK